MKRKKEPTGIFLLPPFFQTAMHVRRSSAFTPKLPKCSENKWLQWEVEIFVSCTEISIRKQLESFLFLNLPKPPCKWNKILSLLRPPECAESLEERHCFLSLVVQFAQESALQSLWSLLGNLVRGLELLASSEIEQSKPMLKWSTANTVRAVLH